VKKQFHLIAIIGIFLLTVLQARSQSTEPEKKVAEPRADRNNYQYGGHGNHRSAFQAGITRHFHFGHPMGRAHHQGRIKSGHRNRKNW